MTDGNKDGEIHPAPDPRDEDSIRVVGDEDAMFECSVCGELVHRFSVRYHGDGQYCPSCWDDVEPHITLKPCSLCGGEFKYDPYVTNLVTIFEGGRHRKPELCDDCRGRVFDEE